MFRQIALLAFVLAWSVAAAASDAWAQNASSQSSLGDRLEQFRGDLAGQPDNPPPALAKKKPAAKPGTPTPPAAKGPPGTPTLAKPNAAATGTGPSSRRTAQPNYRAPRVKPLVEDDANKEPTPGVTPSRSSRQPLPADAQADSDSADEIPAVPLPTVAQPTPRKAPSQAAAADPDAAPEMLSETETSKPAELSRRQVPKPVAAPSKSSLPARPLPPGKDVLLSGHTAALAVEVHGPRKVVIGREALFKLTLQNSSEVAAKDVMVYIEIPPSAEIIDAQASAGSGQRGADGDSPAPMLWQIPHVAARSSETLTIRLIPRQNTPIDLALRWTSLPETSQTSIEVQEPKLAMSLSGPEEVLYGQSRAYRLTISNPGSGDAENVTVSLTPIGRGGDPPASHRLGLLPAGAHKSIEVELTARQAGELMIRANCQADGGLNAEVAQQVLVRRANLHVDVEGPKMKYSGTKGTYRVRLMNTGNAVAEGVNVSAHLPTQAAFHGASGGGRVEENGKVLWTVGSLQPGEERQLEVHCVLQAPGENRVAVETSASQDLLASAGAVTLVESLADLKLEIHDPAGPISTGDEAVYEVVVKNRGTKTADHVDLMVFFSEGLEATAVDGGQHEIGAGQVAIKTITSIPAGGEKTFKIHTKADRPGNHIFRAEVVCAPLEIKLTSEQATRFYGDDGEVPMVAGRPTGTEQQ